MQKTMRSLLLIFVTCSALPAAAMEALQNAPTAAVGEVVQGVDVARDTLDSYVGTYGINPGFEIRVWREDQRLLLQATGQEAWPLVAESESVFAVPGDGCAHQLWPRRPGPGRPPGRAGRRTTDPRAASLSARS